MRTILVGVLASWALAAMVPSAVAEPLGDIRILIDVSGSMKQNDPQNLRAPALRLLVGLLEKGSRAGVWTYGRYVNMQVPLGLVDEAWKVRARKGAEAIHSRGLFTNIEAALRKAANGWEAPDPRYARSLILLTDGMVDVSTIPQESRASRKRILDQVLPSIRAAGARIHTIALSPKADRELLESLSLQTDGWHEQVEDAETLHRVFLRMFEKAAKRDALPMKDNAFVVDSSIEEMTLLVFRASESEPTRLRTPEEREYDHLQVPENVRWHREAAYDLITIEQPTPGVWQVIAAVDPDNRVLVVTNLKLDATQLPSHIAQGEQFDLDVRLLQDGKVLTNQAFLDLVRIQVTQDTETEQRWQWSLRDDGEGADRRSGDGVFTTALGESLDAGQHVLRLLVDGNTFQRQQRQRITVHEHPVQVLLEPADEQDPTSIRLVAVPNEALLQPNDLRLVASMTGTGGYGDEFEIPRTEQGRVLVINGLPSEGTYEVKVTARGLSPRGKSVEYQVGPIAFSPEVQPLASLVPQDPEPPSPEPEPIPEEQPIAEESTDEQPTNIAAAVTEQQPNWWLISVALVIANLLMIGGGILAYRRFFKRPIALDLS